MNILVIGKGFDIAHGLNTQYKEFLDIINLFNHMKDIDYNTSFEDFTKEIKGKKVENKFMEYLNCKLAGGKIEDETNIFSDIKENNFWFSYFSMIYENKLKEKDNWIDFEKTIKEVIKVLEKIRWNNGMPIIRYSADKNIESSIINAINTRGINVFYNHEKFIDILEKDLIKLIRCLEIYLEKFVKESVIDTISP